MPTLRLAARGIVLLGTVAVAQQPGTRQEEIHPEMWIQECQNSGCIWRRGSVVIDANWRWANKDGVNCYKDKKWDPVLCPDGEGEQCARDCAIEGANYRETYGVTTNNYRDALNLKFVSKTQYGSNFGSRLYLMDSEDTYRMFYLKNREFTFDVDVSQLACGLNGALYFVEMDRRGDWDGVNNRAGAKYGTGYCDAQCPHDVKFIKGEANVNKWDSEHDPPIGQHGACCAEMDIWEANSMSTAYTPHPCSKEGLFKCDGVDCGDNEADQRYDGVCDKDGCDFNNFRMGEDKFYGKGFGFDVDTSRPMTVVTQFITHDGTDTGDLVDIKRFYVQGGRVIENSEASILGGQAENSITDGFCERQKRMFGDKNDFAIKGGLKKMGEALDRGMVLVMSLWDDTQVNMLWLDSAYPTDAPPRKPGVMRGPCPGGETSKPEYLRSTYPDATVQFSQIKIGSIGSTFRGSRRMEESATFV